jgi:hypothetical protein
MFVKKPIASLSSGMAQDWALEITTLTLSKPTTLSQTVQTTTNEFSHQGKPMSFHNATIAGLQTTLKRTAINVLLKNIMPSRSGDINPRINLIKGMAAEEEVVEAIEVDIIHKQ